jgi:hypothetical protein
MFFLDGDLDEGHVQDEKSLGDLQRPDLGDNPSVRCYWISMRTNEAIYEC